MVMVHGDDKGLKLPPKIAPIQVVITPITKKNNKEDIIKKANELMAELKAQGIRVEVDSRDNSPGWKYNYWELRGVPIRLELGPRDINKEHVIAARRDTEEKKILLWNNLASSLNEMLNNIQESMLNTARTELNSRITKVTKWTDFEEALKAKNLVLAPWCGKTTCEEEIKEKSKDEDENDEDVEKLTGSAKSLCIPFDQDVLDADSVCVNCMDKSKCMVLFGRSY